MADMGFVTGVSGSQKENVGLEGRFLKNSPS
jgi:hypothetical protein